MAAGLAFAIIAAAIFIITRTVARIAEWAIPDPTKQEDTTNE